MSLSSLLGAAHGSAVAHYASEWDISCYWLSENPLQLSDFSDFNV